MVVRVHDGRSSNRGEFVSAGTEVDFIGRTVVERLVAASPIVQVHNRTPILPRREKFFTAGTAGTGNQYTFSTP
jgi:hypothetical protein